MDKKLFVVDSVQVVLTEVTDTLYIKFTYADGSEIPSPMPFLGYPSCIKMDVAADMGVEYCKKVFGVTPEVISSR
jgi:hypothetical protein